MGPRFAACGNAGNRAPELRVVASEPDGVPGQGERNDESRCGVDREDAAGNYAFQLSERDGTRAYGAPRCPAVGDKL